MDPLSIFLISSGVLGMLSEGARQVVNEIKYNKNVALHDVENVVEEALSKAYTISQQVGDRLANQLASISFIQRTPALVNAIDRVYNKVKHEQAILSQDLDKVTAKANVANSKLADAENASIFKQDKLINPAIKEVNKFKDEAKEFQEKYEKRI